MFIPGGGVEISSANIIITALIVGGLVISALAILTQRAATMLLAAGLLVVFAGLAIGVQNQGWVTGLDASTASWFSAHRSHWLTPAAIAIETLSGPAAVAFIGMIGGALLSWRSHSVTPGVVTLGTVGAAVLVKTVVKAVVATAPIPPDMYAIRVEKATQKLLRDPISWQHDLLPTGPNAFPSGHLTGTAAVLGIVAVCVGVGRSRRVKAWLAILALVAVFVAASSRLYLGAHWLTDIIGAALLAGVFVTLGASLLSALRPPSAGREDRTRDRLKH